MKANKRLTKAFKHAETITFDKNSKFIFLVTVTVVMTVFQMNLSEPEHFFYMLLIIITKKTMFI